MDEVITRYKRVNIKLKCTIEGLNCKMEKKSELELSKVR